MDGCCHSLLKCNIFKRFTALDLKSSRMIHWSRQHCDCVYFFKICLDNLNTTLSNEVALLHSVNTTECYTNDHPIIKCKKFESYPEWKAPFLRFASQAERNRFINRCSKYELDKNKPKQVQLRDVPFNYHVMSVNDTRNISPNNSNLCQG